jgi:hypothetical protein
VVPVTRECAVLDATAIQRKAHMRAAIVEREDTTTSIGPCGPRAPLSLGNESSIGQTARFGI